LQAARAEKLEPLPAALCFEGFESDFLPRRRRFYLPGGIWPRDLKQQQKGGAQSARAG